jgi:hypothetical protein
LIVYRRARPDGLAVTLPAAARKQPNRVSRSFDNRSTINQSNSPAKKAARPRLTAKL